ncbi:MAG: sigma-70 family RNA polymerase sigma factor [Proteobacteria bacterium]|nr:sigma-70 family RNA polymerase sigma factor [Pseudomonadota bacterium]
MLPLVYEELRRLATRHLRRERDEHTLQRTALVHEAFLRLVEQRRVDWRSRGQFFGIASRIMRRVLVDHARARLAGKRGAGAAPVPLEEYLAWEQGSGAAAAAAELGQDASPVDFLAIDAALTRLHALDPRQSDIVELRFFGGLDIEATAEALGISAATVKREWALARAWLGRELASPP